MLVGYVLYRKMHGEHIQADVIQVHATELNATGHLMSIMQLTKDLHGQI